MKGQRKKPLTPLEEATARARFLEYQLCGVESQRDALTRQLAQKQTENDELRRRYEELCDEVFRPGFRPDPESFAGRAMATRKKSKMPVYEVLIEASCTVGINAETEEQALERAAEEVSFGDLEFHEAKIKSRPQTAHQIDSLKRHADLLIDMEAAENTEGE